MSKKIKAKEYMNWGKTITNDLTPLDALENIKQCLFWSEKGIKEIEIIETALKALEIIRELPKEEKQTLLNAVYTHTKSEKDYDLLREVLSND